MTIYIDPPSWPAHGTVFSHLVSDSSLNELHALAAASGISKRAFDRDHYDVPAHLYGKLVAAGAVEVSGAELTRRLVASGLRIPLKERPEKIRPRLLRAWEALFTPRLKLLEDSAAFRSEVVIQVRELGEHLLKAWEQPQRAYHHSGHLSQMLADLEHLHGSLDNESGGQQGGAAPLSSVLAVWFHDAVYEGEPGEDERRSEQLASTSLEPLVTAGLLSEGEILAVCSLVRATVSHEVPPRVELPEGLRVEEIQAFLDADMAILAAKPGRYRRYLRGIRSEYSHFDDYAFRAGRLSFLRSMEQREHIFLTPSAYKLWESRARVNLASELQEWEQNPQGLVHALRS